MQAQVDAALPAHLALPSLRAWCDACFGSLPEHSVVGDQATHGDTGADTDGQPILPLGQLQSIFDEFERHTLAALRDDRLWLSGMAPCCVTSAEESGPGSTDLQSPFVRRVRVRRGERIYVFGDLHGSVHSLLRSLLRLLAMGVLTDSWTLSNPSVDRVLFLGDLVDRGLYGVEVRKSRSCA